MPVKLQCEWTLERLFFYPPWKDADPADLVLLPNVTTGNSTVVKSIVKQFLPGNSIYTLNLAYGALLVSQIVFTGTYILHFL